MPPPGPAPALPPIEIKPSWMSALFVAVLVLSPFGWAVGVPLVLGEPVTGGDLLSTFATVAVLGVIAAAVIVPMLRSQRRMRERLLAEAPAGTVLATLAAPLKVRDAASSVWSGRYDGWTNGVLVVGSDGVTFRKRKTDPAHPEVHLPWAEVERVESVRENPARVVLRVYTRDGQVRSWQVPGAPAVEAALRRLRDGDPPSDQGSA